MEYSPSSDVGSNHVTENNSKNNKKEDINDVEKKKEISQIEIDGIKLETEKYYFEYPERIQKETGILGYERNKISDEALFKFLKDVCDKKNIDLSSKGIIDFGSFREKLYSEDGWEFIGKTSENILMNILKKLSNGEYPNHTINHQFSAYGSDDNISKAYMEDFRNDKFFVQKIYDRDVVKRHEIRGNYAFRKQENSDKIVRLKVFNKITNEVIHERKDLGYLVNLSDQLDKNEIFTTTGDSGLNFSAGGFFSSLFSVGAPSFGFSGKDVFLNQYLDKALEFYIKQGTNDRKNNLDKRTIADLVQAKIFSKDFTKDYLNSEMVKNTYNKKEREASIEFLVFKDKIKEELQKIELQFNCDINTVMDSPLQFIKDLSQSIAHWINYVCGNLHRQNYSNTGDGAFELYLPIFINNDEIPQLSWGHAKYAHYTNEKGLNFIEFKHADHLPVKE